MADYVRKCPGLADACPLTLSTQQWPLSWESWGPMNTPADTTARDQLNPVEANSYEIFPVDITEVARAKYGDLKDTEMQAAIQELLVNDYVATFNSHEDMDDDCLDGCREYTVNCPAGQYLSSGVLVPGSPLSRSYGRKYMC